MTLAPWILAVLLFAAPPERAPSEGESLEARRARYVLIANDIALAAESDAAPREAAALLAAVAVHESGLSPLVDRPECAPELLLRRACDGGAARSLWQLHAFTGETRLEAAREALRRLRASERACRFLPASERLASYARGACDSGAGQRLSRDLTGLAARLLRVKEARP